MATPVSNLKSLQWDHFVDGKTTKSTSGRSFDLFSPEILEGRTVSVNCSAVNTNYAPYAGWKDSGYGLELSRKAVFEYLKTKHIKVELV